jgi:WD40 repeat protein
MILAADETSGGIFIWDVETQKELERFKGDDFGDYPAAFSCDSKFLATKGGEKTVWIWEVATGKKLHKIECPHEVHTLAFSPKSMKLATAGAGDFAILIWNLEFLIRKDR